MKTPEQIFDEAIKEKGLDIVSVKDADLYEVGLYAISKALNTPNEECRSEQLPPCKHIKRIGESCTLNNKCTYPNCE